MVTMFVDTLPSPFYDKAIGSVVTNFADLVTIGERIESGIRRGKFAQTSSNTGFTKEMTGFEKKRGETNAILVHPSGQSKIILSKSEAMTSVYPASMPKRENSSNTTNNRSDGRNRVFTPIHMTYTALFPKLLQKNLIAVLPLKPLEPPYPRSYDPNTKCDYHAGAVGHSTERCWSFKHKVQDLIEAGWLGFEENEPNEPVIIRYDLIHQPATPLIIQVPARPAYKDDHTVPWQYDSYTEDLPAESIDDNSTKEKAIEALKGKEAEEFLKLIQYSEYKLLEQMNKTLARISLLSLLLNSEGHRNLLLKVLKEAHVAQDITMEKFGGMVNNITGKRCVTFSK
ncbi:hypothetical protein CR513_02559, partial [Mucuna pruriens]